MMSFLERVSGSEASSPFQRCSICIDTDYKYLIANVATNRNLELQRIKDT